MKECNRCKKYLDDNEFYQRKDRQTLRPWCRGCDSKLRYEREKRNLTPEQKDHKQKKTSERLKKQRTDPEYRAKFIVRDTRSTDKKANRENNLDQHFVKETIKNGCYYCGEQTITMTLDRIDNTIGHLKHNVIPSCYRCNMIRGCMPYMAWINIIGSIRNTREKGLFDTWQNFGPWTSRNNAD